MNNCSGAAISSKTKRTTGASVLSRLKFDNPPRSFIGDVQAAVAVQGGALVQGTAGSAEVHIESARLIRSENLIGRWLR